MPSNTLAFVASFLSLVACERFVDAAKPLQPAVLWDFEGEPTYPGKSIGKVEFQQPGPRPPEFPDFPPTNSAMRLGGSGSYLAIDDPGEQSVFDFTNGDALTISAWVNINPRPNQFIYIIGKGRTNAPGQKPDNQNWSLRLSVERGVTKLSFLFATSPTGSGTTHWHRWTSEAGFLGRTGWHQVAITYRFGEPDSIRGWIDGEPTGGVWDLGGKTRRPPIVDNDQVWIGSSLGGNPPNSFSGLLDQILISRELAEDSQLRTQFNRTGGPRVVKPAPPRMPDVEQLVEGEVTFTIGEGLPTHESWLVTEEKWPDEKMRWRGHSFLLPRIPRKYDSWGIRADWNAPLLLRMAGDVTLPPGRHQFLVRARSLSRLWVDGVKVAETAAITHQPPNGEEPITPPTVPPSPGARVAGYHQQEKLGWFVVPSDKSTCRVVLESVIGGKLYRTESGETCLAIQLEGKDDFRLLQPDAAQGLSLTDAAIEPLLDEIEAELQQFDDTNRRQAASSMDEFWRVRHEFASRAAQEAAQDRRTEGPESHPIDEFLAAKIQTATRSAAASPERAEQFERNVLGVLRKNCFRCHSQKSQGGLRLDSLRAMRRGGDSGISAIVPGAAQKSELIRRIRSHDESERMPPTGRRLTAAELQALATWIDDGAVWLEQPLRPEDTAAAPSISDGEFLRRVSLDIIGVPASRPVLEAFLASDNPSKRLHAVDRLLDDEQFADHWMGYWLDMLAENPTLLNASLNSTGPFRWFLYDSLRDGKPWDRLVTELIQFRGSVHGGGSAGFALAAENDAPYAAKAHIVASAFLGIELQCARCHDSPYHSTTQRDLYALSAMLANQDAAKVPETSRVPAAFFEQQDRASLITATLKPQEKVVAAWPFAEVCQIQDNQELDKLTLNPADRRQRLAALITSPQNARFARVLVNRIWKRMMGAGIVEPVHDWESREPSHPQLLDWLAQEFIQHRYDPKHVVRLIATSQAYQRKPLGDNLNQPAHRRFFQAPDLRRLSAEQIVDSLHAVTGHRMNVEELTFVHDGRRAISNRLSLGQPQRAWMFASLNNERDRPSLSLPRARSVADVLEAFGWTGSRQQPVTHREKEPHVLQPGVLANGVLTATLTRVSDRSHLADLAVRSESPQQLVKNLFLDILSREPTAEESAVFAAALADGFSSRIIPPEERTSPEPPEPLPLVTWFNHLRPEASTIQQEMERRTRAGPPADRRLAGPWREIYEDAIWSLLNHHEFIWIP